MREVTPAGAGGRAGGVRWRILVDHLRNDEQRGSSRYEARLVQPPGAY
jgi:hypothetical protein